MNRFRLLETNGAVVVKTKQPKRVRHFLIGETIGKGAYSTVKEAVDEELDQLVAIKICSKQRLRKIPNGFQQIEQEVNILKNLNHPNVVNFYQSWVEESNEKIYIVLEYLSGGSLGSLLKHHHPTENEARRLFASLINGLEYLHSINIVHGDIKPDNLLLTSDGVIKIADFTVAFVTESNQSSQSKELSAEESDSSELSNFAQTKCGIGQGTIAFQPPEVISGSIKFSSRGIWLDLWAAGIVLYIMVVGKYPYHGDCIGSLIDSISKAEIPLPETLSDSLRDLLSRILDRNPNNRLCIEEIKAHPWMKGKQVKLHVSKLNSLFEKKRGGYRAKKLNSHKPNSCYIM